MPSKTIFSCLVFPSRPPVIRPQRRQHCHFYAQHKNKTFEKNTRRSAHRRNSTELGGHWNNKKKWNSNGLTTAKRPWTESRLRARERCRNTSLGARARINVSSDESLRCQVTATDTLVQVVLLAGISVDTYVISHFPPFLSISSRLVSKFLPTSKRKKQEKMQI